MEGRNGSELGYGSSGSAGRAAIEDAEAAGVGVFGVHVVIEGKLGEAESGEGGEFFAG